MASSTAYFKHKFAVLQWYLLGGYGVMCLLCVALVVYMRHHRHSAWRGDASAARKIILPTFEPLLWTLGATTGVYTVFLVVALSTPLFDYDISKLATEFLDSSRQFVFVSVLVFLFHKSVSVPALRRSLCISFLLSTYTIPIVWYLVSYVHPTDCSLLLMFIRGVLLLFYGYVAVRPPARASKRSIREYSVFTLVYYTLLFAYMEMFRRKRQDEGFALTYANLAWGAMCPLVIWRVLKADTEHWRGLGQRAISLQSLVQQRCAVVDEHLSSHGFHELIEMHRKHIIDFAYLQIYEQIGVSATAVVFQVVLHSRTQVAVKVYTPDELTEATVAAFSHEAALSIALVSELCDASLDEVLLLDRRSDHQRQQFLISLGYVFDAVRAIAYLHSFSPPFVHRDINPSNFLVDEDGNVKLTDFGESRSLPRPGGDAPSLQPYMVVASLAHVDRNGRYSSSAVHGRRFSNTTLMTVRGTVDYMAPEVINGRAGVASYGEAADVYSLAVTMWDILHPGRDKFPTTRGNHLQIFESVIDGRRPAIDDHVHPSVRELIQSAWQSDARARPSAQTIVQVLESVYEEAQAFFAAQLVSDVSANHSPMIAAKARAVSWSGSFAGSHAVAHMVASGYVNTTAEAVRLGNGLMDAGHLHHTSHTRGFENANELYYFDESSIQMSLPLGKDPNGGSAVEGRPSRLSHTSTTCTSNGTQEGPQRRSKSEMQPLNQSHGMCSCRKLGQRTERGLSRQHAARKAKSKHKLKVQIDTIMEEITSTGLTRRLLQEEEHASVSFSGEDHDVIDERSPAAG